MRLQLNIIEVLREKSLTINQIAKALNESYSFVNRIVNKMIEDNLILKEVIGHSIVCHLNKSNDKTKALTYLIEVNKRDEFLKKNKEIKLITEELKLEADATGIFGSYAKGTHNKESDIDIFIITNKKIDMTPKIRTIHAKYGKEISPLVLSREQFNADQPIIKEIIKYHILLTGFDYFINHEA